MFLYAMSALSKEARQHGSVAKDSVHISPKHGLTCQKELTVVQRATQLAFENSLGWNIRRNNFVGDTAGKSLTQLLNEVCGLCKSSNNQHVITAALYPVQHLLGCPNDHCQKLVKHFTRVLH